MRKSYIIELIMSKQVILTGLRANNDLHIGSYLGAILPMVDMANKRAGEYQFNMFVPDLHSFTTPIDHTKFQEGIINNLRVFAAAGFPIDHTDVYLYRQSYIDAPTKLTWILDCFTGFGEMSRMIEFKDKSARFGTEHISMGQFNYPVLMAADMLLYNATYVPVGDDQRQHLEFTRDIAMRMNNKFNQELFVVPKPVKEQHAFFGKDQGLRIKDLADPAKKMSKSDETGKGVIFLNDTPEAARKKIMSATTDSYGRIAYNHAEQPGISNMLDLLALLGERDKSSVLKEFVGQTQYGSLKQSLADVTAQFLTDFQLKLQQVDNKQLLKKLAVSEAAMNKTANETLDRVQKAVGLR